MKYAYFNYSGDKRVLQFIDTEAQNFNLPDAAFLHECTPEEWALDRSLSWMVSEGAIVPYVAPSIALDALKQIKIAEINTAFKNELAAGFTTTSGIKMDADVADVQLLKSAYDLVQLLGQTVFPLLVDYNNESHANVLMADVITIIIEVGVNYQTVYAKKQTLRSQALAAADQTELSAISW